jgi:4-hydroxy 2-oxovalerate aldolase
MRKIEILDCTIRDGGYVNQWDFSVEFVKALYAALSQAGVSYMETGFLAHPAAGEKVPWTSYHEDVYADIKQSFPGGCKLALLMNFGDFALDEMVPAKESSVDMIRVACHKKDRQAAAEMAAGIHALGYASTVNFMGLSSYSPADVLDTIGIINRFADQVTCFYFADSFGSLFPCDIRKIYGTVQYATDVRLGFHPHNNLQMAFANCLEAMEAGVTMVDGSVFGMGRGAGNLYTEAMVAYLERNGAEGIHLQPILQFADLFMEPLREKLDWGISLPQLISGILACHPNYPSHFLEQKMHTADDIYQMLKSLDQEDAARYSTAKASQLRAGYVRTSCGDDQPSASLQELCRSHDTALLVCGGPSVERSLDRLQTLAREHNALVVAVNNPNPPIEAPAVFFGNQRRLLQHKDAIATRQEVLFGPTINPSAERSFNIPASRFSLKAALDLDFPSIIPANSGVMAIMTLAALGMKKIYVAGLDGFSGAGQQYYYAEADSMLPETQAGKAPEMEAELVIVDQWLRQQNIEWGIVTDTMFKSFAI